MITVDADRKTFTPPVIRKAYNQALRESGKTPDDLDAWIKKCLWIVAPDQLACYENSGIMVSCIIKNQIQGAVLKGSPVPRIICGAPVYRHLAGDIGAPDGSGPDILLIAPGNNPEVFLRITNLGIQGLQA